MAKAKTSKKRKKSSVNSAVFKYVALKPGVKTYALKVKTRSAKDHGLSARTRYEALSGKGNPSLKTIAKLVQMACAA